jgi:hypothetical protein
MTYLFSVSTFGTEGRKGYELQIQYNCALDDDDRPSGLDPHGAIKYPAITKQEQTKKFLP